MKRLFYSRAVDELNWLDVENDAQSFASLAAQYRFEVCDPVLALGVGGSRMDPSALVRFDLTNLMGSELVLCDMTIPNRNYIGCCFELSYAYAWQMPIVVVVGETTYGDRPWLAYHATHIVRTKEEGLRWLDATYGN